jgi:thymidylate synthase (FAD)
MKFIEQSAEIITTNGGDKPLELIELCARTCYQSQDKITEGSAEKMVNMLVKNGHMAMIEHLVITMRLITSRGLTHELVRHRMASYAQQSTRYCDSKDMHIIIPSWLRGNDVNSLYNNYIKIKMPPSPDVYLCNRVESYFTVLSHIEKGYNYMLEQGSTKQEARGIFPNDLATEIIVTTNAREWLHILSLRDNKAAHPDMQYLASIVRKQLTNYCPILFEKK